MVCGSSGGRLREAGGERQSSGGDGRGVREGVKCGECCAATKAKEEDI